MLQNVQKHVLVNLKQSLKNEIFFTRFVIQSVLGCQSGMLANFMLLDYFKSKPVSTFLRLSKNGHRPKWTIFISTGQIKTRI